jgi:hypothetical protein
MILWILLWIHFVDSFCGLILCWNQMSTHAEDTSGIESQYLTLTEEKLVHSNKTRKNVVKAPVIKYSYYHQRDAFLYDLKRQTRIKTIGAITFVILHFQFMYLIRNC